MPDKAVVWLTQERPLWVLFVVAGTIGLGFAWWVLGWEGIKGTSDYWQTTHNDALQGIAALRYYLHEPWSWSVLEVASYGAPLGTNLILTDSIPLLAVPAKAVSAVFPDDFHYFGYWLALSFVLQPVAMVALQASLDVRNLITALAGSILALLQTILLARFFHAALMGQFLIIAALALGIRVLRRGRSERDLFFLLGLVVAVFFVHPYLFAMILAIGIGFAIQAGLSKRVAWRSVGVWIGLAGVATGTLVAATGLAGAASYTAFGFGHFSMNGLSLFGHFNATGGQYEGAAYLGLGVIILAAVVLATARDLVLTALRRFWVPLVVVLALALYAMSTSIWIGNSIHIKIPNLLPIEWLGSRFRSSGRFVWPLVYVVVGGGVALAYRRLDKRTVVPLLLGVSLIQIAEMAPEVSDLRYILHGAEPQVLVTDVWSQVIEAHDYVWAAPHQCAREDETTGLASRELQRLAALAHVPVAPVAIGRFEVDCGAPPPAGPLRDGELRVIWATSDNHYDLPGARCVNFGLGIACTEPGRRGDLVDALAIPTDQAD